MIKIIFIDINLDCPDVKEKEVRTIQPMKTMKRSPNLISSQNYLPSHLDHLSIEKVVSFIIHVICTNNVTLGSWTT